MTPTFYNFESSPDALRFEFDSISPQKHIRKIVEYTPLPQNPNIYNLGFGDLQEDGSIDDLIVSDNNRYRNGTINDCKNYFLFF